MDENNIDEVVENKKEIPAELEEAKKRYEELEKVNSEIHEMLDLMEADEKNREKFSNIAKEYGIDKIESKDLYGIKDELKSAFFDRANNSRQYLDRLNEIIEKYNNDEIKTKYDLQKRIVELNDQYKEMLVELNGEYDKITAANKKDKKQNSTEETKEDSNLNINPLDINATTDSENLSNSSTNENIKFNNSVTMLYGTLKKELDEQESRITYLNKLVEDTENLEKKYLKELREAEAKRDVLKAKMDNFNFNDSYSKITNNENTNVFAKLRNNHMDSLDKKVNKIDKQLEKNKDDIVYLWGQNGSPSDPKKMRVYKKIEKLKKKRATIHKKQKMVVDKQLEKYYKEQRKKIAESRTYAKLEYEVLNTYKVQDDISKKQEEHLELENKKNEVGKIVGMIYATRGKVNELETKKMENKLSRLKDKVGNIKNDELSTEIQQKYGRQI